jgi:hypothetical protein
VLKDGRGVVDKKRGGWRGGGTMSLPSVIGVIRYVIGASPFSELGTGLRLIGTPLF